jgi:hypothetical protein
MRFPWQNSPPSEQEVADEFVEFLRHEWGDLKIGAHDAGHVEVSLSDGADGKLYLHKLHGTVAGLRRNNPKTRRTIYRGFAQQMLAPDKQIPDLESLDSETMAAKIFPRIVRRDIFNALGDELEDAAPPSRPFADTNFLVVYVLDFDDRVAYVMKAQAETLNMNEEQLYEQGLINARALFPHEKCRELMAQFDPKKVAHFLECPDGHAGARLLVLPEYLEENEEVAALILENSAFLLALTPPNNNWNPLREIAKQGGAPFVQQPFLVTRQGIKAM